MRSIGGIMFWQALAILFFCLPAPAQTTRSTRPATTAATRPATKPNPLATPVTAVEFLFKSLQREDYTALRTAHLEQMTVSELRWRFAPMLRQFQAGTKMTVVDTRQLATVASVMCKATNAQGKDFEFFALRVIRRFDDWKVESGRLNKSRLTPGEKDQIEKLNEWSLGRLKELRSTTQPATAPSVGAVP